MTAPIKTLQHKLSALTQQLTHFKTQLSSLLSPLIAQRIKVIVHIHNQQIYNHCKNTKDKKLANLCTSTTNHCTKPADHQSSQIQKTPVLVHCIPDSLPLTDSKRSVLTKGLKFVPLRPIPASTIPYLTVSSFSAHYVGWLSFARSLVLLHFLRKTTSSLISFNHISIKKCRIVHC